MSEDQFTLSLATLVAKEAREAKNDPERFGSMIERLSAALGMTIALAAKGQAKVIDTLITGCEAHIHAEAVDKARVIRAVGGFHDR